MLICVVLLHAVVFNEGNVRVYWYSRQKCSKVLRTSCLTLEIKEFRCYEVKIEESEKAGSRRESNPGQDCGGW